MDRRTGTFDLRVTAELNDLLRLDSTPGHRTLRNMVEFLVREHCERHRPQVTHIAPPTAVPAHDPALAGAVFVLAPGCIGLAGAPFAA